MSLLLRPLARVLVAPLLALFSGACATLLDPGPPVLRIRTDTVAATVRDANGHTLGTTPFQAPLRARHRQTLVIAAPGYDSAVVTVGRRVKGILPTLVNPLSWPVDAATGAYWTHDPGVLDVRLAPTRQAMDSIRDAAAGDSISDAVAAVVLAEFADVAEAAGCEPLLVGAWRDAALVLAASDSSTPPSSLLAFVAEEVRRAAPEIRELCAHPGPRMAELGAIRRRLSDSATDVASGPPLALAPVYFGVDEWDVRDDSVRARLHALAARLAEAQVTLVVEGFADPAELRHQELGYQRALSVIRVLRAAGLAADCCMAISHSGDSQALGEAAGRDPRLNRRVTLTLDYRGTP
jgi:outer membrane protein OmpA-like peptidoglycan-associated protein